MKRRIFNENNEYLDVIIHNKDVKNINIRINSKKEIVVSKNKMINIEYIDQLIIQKWSWIEKHLEKIESRFDKEGISVSEGVYIFNRYYALSFAEGNQRVLVDNDKIVVYAKKDHQVVLKSYLKAQLIEYIESLREKYDQLVGQYNIKAPEIRYKQLKGKWGYCQYQKSLIVMNTRLIHYPKSAIEYVLFHEYTHLIVPNHSKRFYDIILHHMPRYKEFENLLK